MNNPTLLMECANQVEAAAVKSLLEQNGIAVTLQTENANAMMPHLAFMLTPRLLVLEQDLEAARALLNANPSTQTEGTQLDGGICAVHEQPAVAICARCGSFLCRACESMGEPPVCESCLEIEKLPEQKPASPGTVVYVVAGVLVLGLLISLLTRL